MKVTIKGLTDLTISMNKLNITIRGNHNDIEKWPNSVLKNVNIETKEQLEELESLAKNNLISFVSEEILNSTSEKLEDSNEQQENIANEELEGTEIVYDNKPEEVTEKAIEETQEDTQEDTQEETQEEIEDKPSKLNKEQKYEKKNSKKYKTKKEDSVKINKTETSDSKNKGFKAIKLSTTQLDDDVAVGTSFGAKKTKTFKSICADESNLNVKESLKMAEKMEREDEGNKIDDEKEAKDEKSSVVIHTGKDTKKIKMSKNLSNSANGIKDPQVKFINEDQEDKNDVSPFIDMNKDNDIDFVEI